MGSSNVRWVMLRRIGPPKSRACERFLFPLKGELVSEELAGALETDRQGFPSMLRLCAGWSWNLKSMGGPGAREPPPKRRKVRDPKDRLPLGQANAQWVEPRLLSE